MKRKNKKIRKSKFVKSVVPVEDIFLDENSKINLEDAIVMNATHRDIVEEIHGLDSFRDYVQESRGNSLNFGDY